MNYKRSNLIVLIIYLCLGLVFSGLLITRLVHYLKIIDITNIEVVKLDKENNKITIKITKNNSLFTNDFNCNASYNDTVIKSKGIKNECNLTIDLSDKYHIYLNSTGSKSKEYSIKEFTNNILDFKFDKSVLYMVLGEQKEINYSDTVLIDENIDYKFASSDERIIKIEDHKLRALSPGEVEITSPLIKQKMKIIVTDLISTPTLSEKKKSILPCENYTKEESEFLDNLLAYRINEAGTKTRGAVIAAARFLTLEFKYRIPYFYENGRLHKTGQNWTDGEGRYYHEGLYLSEDKENRITAKKSGPQMWGCPLTNWEPAPQYHFIKGTKMPNGLDCSGFVTWVLKNAGFDPGDIGAHAAAELEPWLVLNQSLISSNTIKTGDLIHYPSHIAVIIGIDDDNFYVAESLPHLGGVIAKKYPKSTVTKTFKYIIPMDNYYEKEGNYQNMW